MNNDISLETHEKFMKMIKTCKDDGFQELCNFFMTEEFCNKMNPAYYCALLKMTINEMQKRLISKGSTK